jgi:gliding motility-associated-like protein
MLTVRILLVLFLSILANSEVKSQTLNYKKTYHLNCSSLTKTFELDVIENSRSQSIVQLSNGRSNFILERQVNGVTTPAFVTIGSSGNILNARQLVNSSSILLKTHKRLVDNGFIAIGVINVSGLNRAIVVRLDSNLNMLWSSTLASSTRNVNGQHIVQTSDGGFAFVNFLSFSASGSGPENVILCKLNSAGALIWQRQYQILSGSFVYDLRIDTDGGFLINGFTGGPIYDGYFFKTDSSGLNVVWSFRHGGPNNDTNISTHRVASNEYIAFGYNRGFSSFLGVNMYAIRFNSSTGQVLWSRQFGTNSEDITTEVIRLQDGNFLITAVTNVASSPSYQNLYVKMSPSGSLLWSSKNSSSASLTTELEKVVEMQDQSFRATATDYGGSSNRAKVFAFNCLGQNSCSMTNFPVSVSNNTLPIFNQAVTINSSTLQYSFNSLSTTNSNQINFFICSPPVPCSDTINIFNSDTSICLSQTLFLNGSVISGAGYLWRLGSTVLSTSSSFAFTAQTIGSLSIRYSVFLGNCTYEDSINIQVQQAPCYKTLNTRLLLIPNTVTMNGDGFNDLFKIENLSLYAQNQLQILNRWGRVVFKSDNYQNNWPPSDVVAGAYYYVLDLNGPEETYKGWIEVLK